MGKGQSKLRPHALDDLAAQVHFDKKELQQWYTVFMKDCPSGCLTRESFVDIYKQFFPSGDATEFAHYAFKAFDRDSDDVVTFAEFVRGLSVTSRGNLDEKLDWAFRLYDLDHDGYISRKEMESVVGAIYKLVGDAVALAPEEEIAEKRVDKLFILIDKKADGKIDREEFCHLSKMDPAILQALSLYDGLV